MLSWLNCLRNIHTRNTEFTMDDLDAFELEAKRSAMRYLVYQNDFWSALRQSISQGESYTVGEVVDSYSKGMANMRKLK